MIKGSLSAKTKERDQRAYQYLREQVEQSGRFPTVRELAAALGLSSTSMAAAILARLESRGLIERQGRRRTLAGVSGGVAVPILGTIAAGEPLMAAEQIEGYLQVAPELAKGRALFALKVRGESMIGAGILPGDTVLLEQTATVADGEIAAVWLEDAAPVKRVFRTPEGVSRQPEMERMQPIYAPRCDILGRVIGLVRSYE